MKKISQKKIESELKKYALDETAKDLILVNIQLYNDLVKQYNDGNTKVQYLLYQLNMQIFKQMVQVQKMGTLNGKEIEDSFTNLINTLKKK